MNNSGTQKAASFFRWTARIIGAPVTLMLFYVFTIAIISEIFFLRIAHTAPGMPTHIPLTAHAVISIIFGLIVLAAYIASWWKERLGGFLFVLSSFCVVGMMIFLRIENSRYFQPPPFQWTADYLKGWWMEWAWTGGLPLLVIGILFLITFRLSRNKAAVTELEPVAVTES